jgi:GT2 family glycosyltransferase
MPEPELSAIVCTHNRPDDLRRCLDALAGLLDQVEVLVIDSASSPPCRELVESYATRISGLRYLREEATGLSRARNVGVAAARGAIVAFLDDDTAPGPEWATQMRAAFASDPKVGSVGGACIATFGGEQRPSWLSDQLLQFAGITRFGSVPREARSSAEWPFGANIAFRAQAFPSKSPFDEELGRNGGNLLSGEEWQLVESVKAAGWKIWLEPRAVVEHTVHWERCTSGYYWRRLWWAGVSRARSRNRSIRVALRLLAAAPVRFFLFIATRDRVHLYRTAETAGFLAESVRLRLRPT